MLRIEAGKSGKYCDGLSRRGFVQLGVAGMAAASLPAVLRAKQVSGELGHAQKDTSVILLWLDGGPSHIDMYDMKPDAPAEYRGIWNPIRTNVPGIEISERLPLQAKIADKFSIIRSMHHESADHFTGAHITLTGHWDGPAINSGRFYPSIGSISTKVCGGRREGLPPYVSVPFAVHAGAATHPGCFGASYLGVQHNPFETLSDPNDPNSRVQNMALSGGLTLDRLEDRHALREHFDRLRRDVDASRTMETMDRFERQAYDMVAGPAAREAFDLTRERPELRDRYGRNTFGQSVLLARRLAEAGSTFITVYFPGWDMHSQIERLTEAKMPQVDMAFSSLITDLVERGLLDKVLVVMCGEFGRTPRMNDGRSGAPVGGVYRPGRDHWPDAMACVVAGGGTKGGRVVGSTNSRGEVPKDRPLHPADLHATIYRVLGVDPTVSFLNSSGRPVAALDRGEVIQELF